MSVISRIASNFSRNFVRSGSAVFKRNHSVDNGEYIKSSLTNVEIPNVHLAEYLLNGIGNFSSLIATQCGVTGRKYTYDDLAIKSSNLSASLRKRLKLKKGDILAILLPNVPEYPICVLGALLAGLKVTTINPAYTSDEIQRQLKDSNAKVLITLTEHWNNAEEAVKKSLLDIKIMTIKTKPTQCTPNGAINFQEFLVEKHDVLDIELPSPDDTIFLPYSSGTTGLPKGVQLSSHNIVANICQLSHPELKLSQPTTGEHQDVSPQILPLFHIYSFTTTLSMLKDRVKVVTLPKFDKETFIDVLVKENPHFMLLVPPIVIFLYSCPDVKREYLQSLRTINCGAAPLGALDEEKLRKKIGRPFNITQGYGLSETSPVVTLVPLQSQGKFPGSMGSSIPNTLLKVVKPEDPEGKHLKPNEVGELYVKGPQVMKGYHNRSEETEKAFHDGWFKTGDLVRYDENGMLYIGDRLKELIKVKGFQVPPAELEEVIRDFPGISEAAVIGIPHNYCGELPRAYVVPKKDAKIDTTKLQDFVASKVAKHKHLKGGIAIVDSIPKNSTGKILRRTLKEQYLQQSR